MGPAAAAMRGPCGRDAGIQAEGKSGSLRGRHSEVNRAVEAGCD